MKKIYYILFILFSIIIVILLLLYKSYSLNLKEEQVRRYVSKVTDIFLENCELEKRFALSLAVTLSKNNTIKESLKANNQVATLNELALMVDDINKTTGVLIDIQVHTKDLKAFARSWDKRDYYGEDLHFREGLKIVQKSKEAFVSIELGKRLNIKAIAPIFDNSSYIGSIEVIIGFNGIKKRLKKFGLQFMCLVDKKYIDIAKDLKGNKRFGNYYTAQKNYSKKIAQILEANSKLLKEDKFYNRLNKYIISIFPMKSVGATDVGKLVLLIELKKQAQSVVQPVMLQHYKYNGKKREVVIK